MKFTTTILKGDGNTTGIVVPEEVVEALGAGKRPPVTVTLNGYTYRSSIAVMGGRFLIGVSAEVRGHTGIVGGEELEVELEVDTKPREVDVPGDLAAALDAEPELRAAYDALSYSNKRRLVEPISQAKAAETRQRRIDKVIETLRKA